MTATAVKIDVEIAAGALKMGWSCVLCGFVRARTQCTYKLLQTDSVFLTARDRCELVGHRFDPIKLHKLTMHTIMAISDAIDAREPTVFVVEEARANHLLDADRLLPSILVTIVLPT